MSKPSERLIPKSRTARNIVGVVLGAALLAAFFAPLRNELRFTIFPQDEGLLLVYPQQILKGALPNHTFDSVYGVTNLWVLAAASKVFGATVTVERAVGTAYRLVLVASLVGLVWRRRGPVAAAIAGILSIILLAGTLGVAAFAWIGALACCSLAIFLLDVGLASTRRPAAILASGTLLGLAVGFRLDIGLAVGLMVVALRMAKGREFQMLLTGLAVGLVPIVVNVVQAGPASVVRDQILDPVFVSGPYRRLPLSNLSWQQLALLALCVAVAVATLTVGIVGHRADRSQWDRIVLMMIGAFEFGILVQAFQRSDTEHLAFIACFVLPAALLLPVPTLPRVPEIVVVEAEPVAFGVIVLALAWPFFGQIYWSASTSRAVAESTVAESTLANDGRSVIVASPKEVEQLSAILQSIDARSGPGERIFVGPADLRTANYSDTFLYFLVPDLVPGSYYLEMNPGVPNRVGSSLEDDLRNDRFLVLNSQWNTLSSQGKPPPFGPNGPNRVVSGLFRPVTTAGTWTLYDRKIPVTGSP